MTTTSSRSWRMWQVAALLLATALPTIAQQAGPPPTADDDVFWKLAVKLKWAKSPLDQAALSDPRLRTAYNLRRVALDQLDPEAFYRELARTDLGGREARVFLVELKTEMLDTLGTVPSQHFWGEIYLKDHAAGQAGAPAPPGSQVEDVLLTWRREATMQSLREAVADVHGDLPAGGPRSSLFVCMVGSTPQGPGAQAMPGDIDANAVSADVGLAQRVTDRARARLESRLGGLSADSVDVVFTALGQAGPEVYAGEPGRLKAIQLLAEGGGDAYRVDLGSGTLGEVVTGRRALQEVALEGGLRDVEVSDLGEIRTPDAGPAIVFEMARHLDRDVLRHAQYESLDTFVKVAKFVRRANREATAAGHPLDSDLVRFSDDLLAAKSANDYVAAGRVVSDFFAGELPVEVDLGRTPYGKSPATIRANRELVKRFGERARTELLDAGKAYLGDEIKALRGRVRLLQEGFESPDEVVGDAARLSNDMEVERLVLEDARYGLNAADPEIARLVDEVGTVRRQVLRENWQKVLPQEVRRQRVFVEKMLEQGGETNRQLALATLTTPPPGTVAATLEAMDGLNSTLDSLDDSLLADLRGERDWALVLLQARRATYAERARSFLGIELLPDSVRSWCDRAEAVTRGVEDRLNPLFFDNFLARRVQRFNTRFSDSIKASPTGRAGLKVLTAIRLADELPAYWEAMEKGDWEGLAVEFFRRRVPGGTAAEHWVMGNTALACWDLFATVIPPASMAQTVFALGEELGRRGWDLWWSTELDLFIDQLDADATWELEGVQQVGDHIKLGRYRLVTVTYHGNSIDLDEYLAAKREQIGEMTAALRQPYRDRIFPYEHVSADPFLGWIGADDILRENLAHADNVLLLIDDQRDNPHVGVKLGSQLHQLWTTRWEQVKVGFLERVREQLEERHRADVFGAAHLGEALLELDRITAELRVRDQVRAALEKEIGSEPARFVRWLGDWLADRTREAYDLPSVEDSYEKATRVTLHYLEVYDLVLAARDDAEAGFAGDGLPADDNGLRILSTPFLLACRAGSDARDYARWRGLPLETEAAVRDRLGAIKGEWAGGALDEDPASFDQRTVRGVVYHEVFLALWKRVQAGTAEVQGSTGPLDFEVWWELWKQGQVGGSEAGSAALDAARDRLTGAGELAGLGSRDLPLERFRAHDAERDRLTSDFLLHYLLGGGRVEELLERARPLASELAELCAGASSEIEAARTAAATMTARAEELEATLEALGPRLARTPELGATVESRGQAASDAATSTGEATHAAEATALELCRRLEALRGTRALARRHALVQEAEGLAGTLDGHVARGEEAAAAAADAAADAATALADLESVLEEAALVTETERSTGEETPAAHLARAEELLAAARERTDDLAAVLEESEELRAAAFAAVDEVAAEGDRDALHGRVEAAIRRVADAATVPEECPEGQAAALAAAGPAADGAERTLNRAWADADALGRELETAREALETARPLSEGAAAAVELAEGWLERLHAAADDARRCLDLLHSLAAESAVVRVPDVVGRPADEARAAVAAAGLEAALAAGDPASAPDLAYTIQGQSPGAGAPAPDDGVVTLTVYGESAAVRVPAVTGLTAAEARSTLEGAGLVASLTAGAAAPRPEMAYRAAGQEPAPGVAARRGDTVSVTLYGPFDQAAALAGVDCSPWPGTVPLLDAATGSARCGCPDGSQWQGRGGGCVPVAAAPATPVPAPAPDPCDQLATVFWQLLQAGRLDEARAALAQGRSCSFYPQGAGALQSALDALCSRFNAGVLAACQQGDAGRAQALLQQGQMQGCPLSLDAYRCIDQVRQTERNQRNAESWAAAMGVMNEIIRMQQQNHPGSRGQPPAGGGLTVTPAPMPTLPNLVNVAGASGGGGGGAGGGGGGAGRSREECERQYCPMCFNDVDLLSVSVDPQCNSCRQVNAANIQACMSGGQGGSAVATTAVYRVACIPRRSPSGAVTGYSGCSCLGPSALKSPQAVILLQTRSWDQCKATADSYGQ